MSDEPFGRQPKPVLVTFSGDAEDIAYWRRELARRAENGGAEVRMSALGFKIYPRAVNE